MPTISRIPFVFQENKQIIKTGIRFLLKWNNKYCYLPTEGPSLEINIVVQIDELFYQPVRLEIGLNEQ